jgi:hypothetical protein
MNPPSPSQRSPIPLRPPLISYRSSTACHYLLTLTPLQVPPVLLPLLVLHHRLLPAVPRPPPRGLLPVLLPYWCCTIGCCQRYPGLLCASSSPSFGATDTYNVLVPPGTTALRRVMASMSPGASTCMDTCPASTSPQAVAHVPCMASVGVATHLGDCPTGSPHRLRSPSHAWALTGAHASTRP